jgi:hypothetical protein
VWNNGPLAVDTFHEDLEPFHRTAQTHLPIQ